MPRSTMKAEMPLLPLLLSVTAITTMVSADWPCVMNALLPFSTQPSPSRTAVVRIAAASLPEPGSVSPHAASFSPARERRRETAASAPRCRTSRCAPRRGRCARRPTATRSDRRARAPRCRCSSRRPTCRRRRTRARTECPSGRDRPASASSSAGNCCASSHSRTCGLISVSANSRMLRRKQLLVVAQAKVHQLKCITGTRRDARRRTRCAQARATRSWNRGVRPDCSIAQVGAERRRVLDER